MRLVSITCVKNESDIIEAFIRHTAALVEHLVVLDNGSTDETSQILHALRKEGLPLEIVEDPSPGYLQWKRLTHLMHDFAVKRYSADWILPLDADEFVVNHSAEPLSRLLAGRSMPLAVKWRTYVPDPIDDHEVRNPVIRMGHHLAEEGQVWTKVWVPGLLARQASLSLTQGSHGLMDGAEPLQAALSDAVSLAHFPYRNPGQFAQKVVCGYLQFQALFPRNENWGWHYNEAYRSLKADPAVFIESFEREAQYFAVKEREGFQPRITNEPITYLGNELLYTPLVDDRVRFMQSTIGYAENLVDGYVRLLEQQDGELRQRRELEEKSERLQETILFLEEENRNLREQSGGLQERLEQILDERAYQASMILRALFHLLRGLYRREPKAVRAELEALKTIGLALSGLESKKNGHSAPPK